MVPTKSPTISGIAVTTEFRSRSPLTEPLLVDSDKAAGQAQVTSECLDSKTTPRLLLYSEIPSWQQENEYILTGYRPTSGSVVRSLQSLLYINNETVSIYSHLVGCIVFLLLPLHFHRLAYEKASEPRVGDFLSVSIYLLGVAVCFALSATCHIVWNHSAKVAAFGNKLDYLGILVLMWGASIPTIYYGFCNSPLLQRAYWIVMSCAALGCAIFTMNPRFSQPRFRRWRAFMYASFGLSSVIFILHGLILYGWAMQNQNMSLGWMAWMATFNFVGATAYATRIPEKYWPYRFDIFGGSHQIFHVAVMIAACVHYVGLIRAFEVIRE